MVEYKKIGCDETTYLYIYILISAYHKSFNANVICLDSLIGNKSLLSTIKLYHVF